MLVIETWTLGDRVSGELGIPMVHARAVYAHGISAADNSVTFPYSGQRAIVYLGSDEWAYGAEDTYLVAPD